MLFTTEPKYSGSKNPNLVILIKSSLIGTKFNVTFYWIQTIVCYYLINHYVIYDLSNLKGVIDHNVLGKLFFSFFLFLLSSNINELGTGRGLSADNWK